MAVNQTIGLPLRIQWHAISLVVFLLVSSYKDVRAKYITILQKPRPTRKEASKNTRLQPGRHDLFRILSATLATSRGGKTHYGYDALEDL